MQVRRNDVGSFSTISTQRFRYPVTFEIARRAGRIDGESKQTGVVIPFQDLVIGATALEFDYAVATLNVRHFEMIPGLVVKRL